MGMKIKTLFSERTDNLQAITGWLIYFFINILFCIKYNPYEEINPVYFIVFYPLATFGIYQITAYLRIQPKNSFFLLLTFVIALLSVLVLRSDYLKNGIYLYGTLTPMSAYASSLPAWQLFHFPFYLLGNTAYGQLFCLLLFFAFLFCCRTRINIGGIVLLLALSPGFWWEIAVRSDLLCNMLLLFVFLTAQFYYPAYWKNHKILTAFMVGLFLCTKLLVAIPLFLYFFPAFLKMENKEKGGFVLTLIVGFSLPFLPFLWGENNILNHPEYSPFLQQTGPGSAGFMAIASVLIVSLALIWQRMRDLYFFTGLFLFVFILTVAVQIGGNNGWYSVIFDSEFDKSCFNACIPFFLFFIHEMKEKRFDYSNYHIRY